MVMLQKKIVAGQANFVKPLTIAVSVGMAAFLFKGFNCMCFLND
jgi:hypothetical protein